MPDLSTILDGLDGGDFKTVVMRRLKISDPTSGVELITDPFVGKEEAKEAVLKAFDKLESIKKVVSQLTSSMIGGDIPHGVQLEFGMDKNTESGIIRGTDSILNVGKSLDYKHIFGILEKHNVTFESSGHIFIKPCYINLEVLSPEEKRRHAAEIANAFCSLEE